MPIRVHELAKEFKISTAALKKHLSDMGVVVKSHMSPVDEDIVNKIRAKFNEEVAAVKKRQIDRNLLHKKIILAEKKKKEETLEREKKIHAASQKKEEKPVVPVFVEKQIKKAPRKPITSRERPPRTHRENKPVASRKKPPEVVPQPNVTTSTEKKFKDSKKTTEKQYKDKSDHIKAKVKHMKKGGRKKKFSPTEVEEATISKNIKKTLSTSSIRF